MKRLLFLFLICILAVIYAKTSFGEVSVSSRYNYLYVLVHSKGTNSGIFDGRKKIDQFGIEFSRLKQYLESEFTLEGYVYSYDLSNNELDIAHQGWELGDRNYDNPGAIPSRDPKSEDDKHKILKPNGQGLCMLEQAKEDFKTWYAQKHPPMKPNDVPNSVIPKDYILITHCMGGLAARHYIYGKNQNGQRYYRNDIAKVIFISTPQLGANGVMMKDAWDAAQRDAPVIFLSNLTAAFVSSRMLGAAHPPPSSIPPPTGCRMGG